MTSVPTPRRHPITLHAARVRLAGGNSKARQIGADTPLVAACLAGDEDEAQRLTLGLDGRASTRARSSPFGTPAQVAGAVAFLLGP